MTEEIKERFRDNHCSLEEMVGEIKEIENRCVDIVAQAAKTERLLAENFNLADAATDELAKDYVRSVALVIAKVSTGMIASRKELAELEKEERRFMA